MTNETKEIQGNTMTHFCSLHTSHEQSIMYLKIEMSKTTRLLPVPIVLTTASQCKKLGHNNTE